MTEGDVKKNGTSPNPTKTWSTLVNPPLTNSQAISSPSSDDQ